jgi:hypothetical protein
MKLSVHQLSLPSVGGPARKDFGWTEVSVRLEDQETKILPSVTIKVHVPCGPSDTYGAVRELALTRAREILKFASDTLENSTLADFEPKGS